MTGGTINLVDFDLEGGTSYTASSMKAYRLRAKVGIQAYRLWLANSPDWKPRSVGTTRASRNGSSKKSAGTPPPRVIRICSIASSFRRSGQGRST